MLALAAACRCAHDISILSFLCWCTCQVFDDIYRKLENELLLPRVSSKPVRSIPRVPVMPGCSNAGSMFVKDILLGLRQQKKKEMANIIEQAVSISMARSPTSRKRCVASCLEANAAYEARDSAQAQMARHPGGHPGSSTRW